MWFLVMNVRCALQRCDATTRLLLCEDGSENGSVEHSAEGVLGRSLDKLSMDLLRRLKRLWGLTRNLNMKKRNFESKRPFM